MSGALKNSFKEKSWEASLQRPAKRLTLYPSMFLSTHRSKANFRALYICKSCSSQHFLNSHPRTTSATAGASLSTASIYHDAEENGSSNATSAVSRRTRLRLARRQTRSAEPISRSRNALAALRESLAAEEAAAQEPKKSKPRSTPKTPMKNAKTGEAVETSKAKKGAALGAKLEKGRKAAAEITGVSGLVDVTSAGKKAKKPSTSSTTAVPSAKGSTAPDSAVKVAEILPGPTKRSKSKRLTEAQRQKVDAVLLGAKNKGSGVLSKKLNSQIRAMGENETKDALVKVIEEGILLKSDDAKPIKSAISKLQIRTLLSTEKNQSAPITRKTLVRKKPAIRITYPKTPESPAPTVSQSLKEALEAHAKRTTSGRRPTAGRAVPRRSMRDLSQAGSSRPSTESSIGGPNQARHGNSIPTGPLVGKPGFEIMTLDTGDLELTPIDRYQPPVPNLAYGLDRVLFNPGVYHLQDPRSRVFNFDPYLQTIMPVNEFDFNALKRYITSSRDETLLTTAKEEGKKYTGSTSSMTAALAHFHFLLSQWRPINTSILSQDFPVEYHNFTNLQRGPAAIFLKWKDGVYAIDADKQFDTANILSTLGKSMEKLLTLPTEDFERYRKENSKQIPIEEREAPEPFNYTTMGDFLMRSQLDAHDPRLPGTGMFDLKTRAVVAIRMDVENYEQGMDYEIRHRFGEYESFEREYYDLIRAAFLKYSLQVRMGRMDGIFVAFHNTQRIFGFQYISLPEMDLALHGTEDTTIGDSEFKLSIELMNKVLNKATAKYPGKSLRLHFETRNTEVPFMYIFAEPMEEEQINEIQNSKKAAIEEFESRVLGLSADGAAMEELAENLSEEDQKAAEWASMRAQVEETMEKDELDLEEARSLAETMIEESDIYGSEEISVQEKERLINALLESSAFNEVEEEETIVSGEDGSAEGYGVEATSVDFDNDDVEDDEDDSENNDERAEDESILVDGAPTDDIPARNFTENVVDQASQKSEETDGEAFLIDETPADHYRENPTGNLIEDEVLDVSAGSPESIELIRETEGDGNAAGDLTDVTSHIPETLENKDFVPGIKVLENDISDQDDTEFVDNESETKELEQPPHDIEDATTGDAGNTQDSDVLGMTLTIRNKVNNQYVARPNKINSKDKWTIEYALEDVPRHRAALLYQACKARRAKMLNSAKRDDARNERFMRLLWDLSKKGKKWREKQNKIDSEGPPKIFDSGKMKADQEAWTKKVAKSESLGEGFEKNKD